MTANPCLHGNIVRHQFGFDVCADCGERVLAGMRWADPHVWALVEGIA